MCARLHFQIASKDSVAFFNASRSSRFDVSSLGILISNCFSDSVLINSNIQFLEHRDHFGVRAFGRVVPRWDVTNGVL